MDYEKVYYVDEEDIDKRDINVEEYTSVYEKAEEVRIEEIKKERESVKTNIFGVQTKFRFNRP